MRILISGLSGFIGQHLLSKIDLSEHTVFAIVRHKTAHLPAQIEQYYLNELAQIRVQMDCFINLAGENIAAKPWSEQQKQKLYSSRVSLTQQVKEKLCFPPKKVISMSAIGYYGVSNADKVTEATPSIVGFTQQLCEQWENSALAFKDSAVVIFRLGVVLGQGGALEKMRLPYKLALGGKIGQGRQWFSWVHIDDVVNAIFIAINSARFDGIYNLTAPHAVQQKDFAKQYAKSLRRPCWLTIPNKLLVLLLGEMSVLLTHGANVQPRRLLEAGFVFTYDRLESALTDIEKRWGKNLL